MEQLFLNSSLEPKILFIPICSIRTRPENRDKHVLKRTHIGKLLKVYIVLRMIKTTVTNISLALYTVEPTVGFLLGGDGK